MKKNFTIGRFFLRKVLVFLVICSCSINNKTQGGVFWKISGNGLKKPSYLLGTNHGMSGDFLDSIPRFFEILDSVKQLDVERDISNLFTEDSIRTSKKYLPDGTTYRDLLNDDEIAALDSVLLIYSPLNSEKMKWKPGVLLYNLQFIMLKNESKKWVIENPFLMIVNIRRSMDVRVQKIAKFRSYSIIELDSNEELARLGLDDWSILFSSGNIQDQAKEMVEFITESQEDTFLMYAMRETMEAYYLQDLKQMEKWITHPAVLKDEKSRGINYKMTVTRNISWMDKITSSIKKEPTLIVVGVAHLPGDQGVINLLRDEGYTVEPVN